MKKHRLVLSLALALGTGALLVTASCGGPQEGCSVERWSGMCMLKAVNTIRVTEQFPVSFVTLEAVWSPQQNPANPTFTPPDLRQEYRVVADQELALKNHLQQSAPVQCQLIAPPAGVCEPSKLVVAVPQFTPPATAPQPDQPASGGCAEMENAGAAGETSNPIKPSTLGAASFQERYLFDQDSATPSADVAAQIKAAAQMIAAHPELVCVSVTGHITRGESLPLADPRARAVKDMMVAAGVPAARLVAFGAGIPVFGAGADAPPADPQDRNVLLSVLRLRK